MTSESSSKLLKSFRLGTIKLANRVVMAPMTRARAINNIPNGLMVEYYTQRASAGLIITEGVSPSPNGLGYARISGIFSKTQVEGWKKLTDSVHAEGGRIFIQLMHTGRIGHKLNLPDDAKLLAPSAIKASGQQIWTDSAGSQDLRVPEEMLPYSIQVTKNEFVQAAKNAMVAGFDGVELHGANGYLLEQFLSPFSNRRTDEYGGNIVNRSRFVLEVVAAVAEEIGKERTGIRLSPYGTFNDMPLYPEIDVTYAHLVDSLNELDIAYIHLLDQINRGSAAAPDSIKKLVSTKFKNTVIFCGGFTQESAELAIQQGEADLIAFGRPFISNPDLADRFRENWPLAENLDSASFYSAGAKGYADYPAYKKALASQSLFI